MAPHTNFQVVHVNIRGIRANRENLVNYLKHKGFPDFVTINETKIKSDQTAHKTGDETKSNPSNVVLHNDRTKKFEVF